MVTPAKPSIIDTRHDQMFPVLEAIGNRARAAFWYGAIVRTGEALEKAGKIGYRVEHHPGGTDRGHPAQRGGHQTPIVTQGPGAFLGELAQLAGRPALVDAYAREPIKALIIPPDRLRALLIAEAELGERIMRALILRRVGLIETGGGGPVIVGRADNGDVLRLDNFLRRNSHPHQTLDPDSDPGAKALIERFHVDPRTVADRFVPTGTIAAQSHRRRAGAVSRLGWSDRSGS